MKTGMLRTLPTLAFAGSLPTLGLMLASGGSHLLDSPHPATISGRVTYNGRPLSDSTVVLVPAGQPATCLAALSAVAPDGSFTLCPATSAAPLEPGRYDLYICLLESLPGMPPCRTEAGGADPGGQAPSTAASPRLERIPTRFTDPRTSGLWVMVGRGPSRVARIDIALRD
jgi:hypothetical protein